MLSQVLNRSTAILTPRRLAFELLAMLLVVGLADWWSGYELSFSLFYLGPVGYIAWQGGWQAGVLAAMTGTAVWRLADFWAGATYSHPLVAIWNVGIRFGVFLGVALLLDRLRRLLDRERKLARRDALTGLSNALRFREDAADEIERSLRYGHQLTIAYLDLDDFKRLNDTEGHAEGDLALQNIGGIIDREIRRTDHAARLGGDEFAVLMPETGVEDAAMVLDRLRDALLGVMVENQWAIGVSIGAVSFERPPSSVDELLQAADRLMYSVKESGKGAVRVVSSSVRDVAGDDLTRAACCEPCGSLLPTQGPNSTRSIAMRSTVLLCLTIAIIFFGTPPGARAQLSGSGLGPSSQDPVADAIRRRLEHAGPLEALAIGQADLLANQVLLSFYRARVFAPAWLSDEGAGRQIGSLVEAIRRSDEEGLDPATYHLGAIEALLAQVLDSRPGNPRLLADLDLLATDAFLLFGAHLSLGRVDPESLDPLWIAPRRLVDLAAALERVIGGEGLDAVLATLLPKPAGYGRLKQSLAEYRSLAAAGGWGQVASGEKLEIGDSSPRVLELRRRLAVTDSVSDDAGSEDAVSESETFDSELIRSVESFQARHGLDPDGVVGAKTLAALNVSAADRVRQIELSIERWRWLPQDLGDRYLLVNIPEFTLRLFEGEVATFVSKVAVGRAYRRTPVFSDRLRYLVLNPYWEVPTKLAIQDKLPEIKKDLAYLADNGFKVFQGWGKDQLPVDPSTVDWQALGAGKFPYRLRQDPGPKNALGAIKFMFPNRFDVYLHDTPSRQVFELSERDVSSGCIRVERAIDLAETLLKGRPGWDRSGLERALASGKEQVVSFDQPLPIHLLYWTAWIDEAGVLHFRRDLYGRDAALEEALAAQSPGWHQVRMEVRANEHHSSSG